MENNVYVPETFDEWKRLHVERHVNGAEDNQPTWVWDEHGVCSSLGGYVCSNCKTVNMNMPLNRYVNYRKFSGIEYCPSCGLRMNLEAVHGCMYEEGRVETTVENTEWVMGYCGDMLFRMGGEQDGKSD